LLETSCGGCASRGSARATPEFVTGATRSRSPPRPALEPFGRGVGRFNGGVGRERKNRTGKGRKQTSACKHAERIHRRRRGGRLSRGSRAVATRSLSRAVGRLAMTTAERDASTRARASQHRAGLSHTLRLDDRLRNTCRFGCRKCIPAMRRSGARRTLSAGVRSGADWRTSGSPRFPSEPNDYRCSANGDPTRVCNSGGGEAMNAFRVPRRVVHAAAGGHDRLASL
jgi:hypothetical protein